MNGFSTLTETRINRMIAAINIAAEKRIRSGGEVALPAEDGSYRVYGPDGAFLALGRVWDGELRSIKSFFEV